jgi:hypothetical protein
MPAAALDEKMPANLAIRRSQMTTRKNNPKPWEAHMAQGRRQRIGSHPLDNQRAAMFTVEDSGETESRPVMEGDRTIGEDTHLSLSYPEAQYSALAILQLFDAFFEKAAGAGFEHLTRLITQPLVRAQIADLKKELVP